VFEDFDVLLRYIDDSTAVDVGDRKAEFDQLVSYLITQHTDSYGLAHSPACASLTSEQQVQLQQTIKAVIESLSVPIERVRSGLSRDFKEVFSGLCVLSCVSYVFWQS
jgi:hypothetical protein